VTLRVEEPRLSYAAAMGDRGRDLDRLLTFVDAIVAIAITVLVLPLADIAGEVGKGPVTELLAEHTAEMFGFFLSFLVIARLWLTHHAIVSGLIGQTAWIVNLTLAWALTIVFLPFPTALVAEAPDDATTKVLYMGTMAVSSAVLAAIAWAIRRKPDVSDADAPPDPWIAAANVVLFLVALTVSVVAPVTSYWPLLLLLLAEPAVRRIRALGR
jgi:uncharacterized membrane protein